MALIRLQSESRSARQFGAGVLAAAFIAAQYGPGLVRGWMASDIPTTSETRTPEQIAADKAACEKRFPDGMTENGIDPARLMVMDFSSMQVGKETLCIANVAAGKYGRTGHVYPLQPSPKTALEQ